MVGIFAMRTSSKCFAASLAVVSPIQKATQLGMLFFKSSAQSTDYRTSQPHDSGSLGLALCIGRYFMYCDIVFC